MDLLYIDSTKVDHSKDGKKDVLVLTDVLSKFSQAFMTPIQKAITVAKLLTDKWFYAHGMPACIHGDKGHSFENEILEHLYTMCSIRQFTISPSNSRGNSG